MISATKRVNTHFFQSSGEVKENKQIDESLLMVLEIQRIFNKNVCLQLETGIEDILIEESGKKVIKQLWGVVGAVNEFSLDFLKRGEVDQDLAEKCMDDLEVVQGLLEQVVSRLLWLEIIQLDPEEKSVTSVERQPQVRRLKGSMFARGVKRLVNRVFFSTQRG